MQVTDLTGTTWVFHSTLTNSTGMEFALALDFTSNGVEFIQIEVGSFATTDTQTMKYYTSNGAVNVYSSLGWASEENLKTITITGGSQATSQTAINWLQENATLKRDYAGRYVDGNGLKEFAAKVKGYVDEEISKNSIGLVKEVESLGVPSTTDNYIVYNGNNVYVRIIQETPENVLYQPNSDCIWYYIVLFSSTSTEYYYILWTKTEITNATGSTGTASSSSSGTRVSVAGWFNVDGYKSTKTYASLADVIAALKSKDTAYTAITSTTNIYFGSNYRSGYGSVSLSFPIYRSNSSASVRYPSSGSNSGYGDSTSYSTAVANSKGSVEGILSKDLPANEYNKILTEGDNAEWLTEVTVANVNSETATEGQVLTADGNGGASWQTPTTPTHQITAVTVGTDTIDLTIT